jgi:hypothetical protein
VTLSRKYGKQEYSWNGVDATVNARPRPGMFFQGGVSTGKRVEDNCDVIVKVDNPVLRLPREGGFLPARAARRRPAARPRGRGGGAPEYKRRA